jgi:hypothetical protein
MTCPYGPGNTWTCPNQNQIAKQTCVGDDDYSDRRSEIAVSCAFLLSLLPEARAGRALPLEVVDGVLQRYGVVLQESVELGV